jgi:hypothetical protein
MFIKQLSNLPPIKKGDVLTIEGTTYMIKDIIQTYDPYAHYLTMDMVLEIISEKKDMEIN